VTCISTSLCVALSRSTIAQLLRHVGFSLSLQPPASGKIRIRWLLASKSGNSRSESAKPLVIARGERGLPAAGDATIRLGLTRAGSSR